MARTKASEVALRELRRAVARVASEPEECARSPGVDFTRRRKITLEGLLWTLVTWGEGTISAELADAFGWDGSAPTCSAFCQRRSRLRDDVMPRLHAEFLSAWHNVPFQGRFRLVAVDGTSEQLPPSGDPRTRVRSGPGAAEHNEAHPTTLYDVRRRTFEDMEWRGARDQDEPGALCALADRFAPGAAPDGTPLDALFLGDRRFCTYNCLWHLMHRGFFFVLRARDDWVERLLGEGNVPEGCFDVTVERILTRTASAKARSRPDEPDLYRRIRPSTRFDGIARGSRDEFAMTLRVVRRECPRRPGKPREAGDRWINLVTNLPAGEFRARWLVRTYGKRWDHEVGYRHLKHVVGMLDPRSRDLGRAGDEAWGRLTLYNACSLGTRAALSRRRRGRTRRRAPDLTMAFRAMLRMLRGLDVDVEAVVGRHSHVDRGGRHFDRRKRNRSPPKVGYRH
jgi:hypothetical protein